MNTDESRPKYSGRTAMAALFLPRTLQARLAVLGLILVLAADLLPIPYNIIIVLPAYSALIWAWVVAAKDRRRRNKRLTVRRALAGAISGYLAFSLVFAVGTWALVDLVTDGNSGPSGSIPAGVAYLQFEYVMVLAILGILVWIPQRLFTIKVDMDDDGDARRILLGLITAASSALTGVYILILHFRGGQLSKTHWGPLIAGMVFTVVLVGPSYRSLARACWQRGISGIFNLRALRRHWGETLRELENALNRAAERGIASSNESGPEATKTIQDAGNAPK